jgi:hypothetical protein
MLRTIRIPALFLTLASGCQCDIPFSETMTLTLQTDIGGSANCAFQEDDVIDENGDAVTDGDFGEVHYNYEHDGSVNPPPTDPNDPTAPTSCTIHVVSWSGSLADLSKLKADIDSGIEEQGLDPEKASISIDNVGFAEVALEVKTATGADFPLENVGPYTATLNAMGEKDEVEKVIVIDNPATGPVQDDHVTTTEEGAKLAAIFTESFNGGDEVIGTGQADVQFVFGDLGELTDEGEDAPTMTITVEVTVDGTLTAGF